MRTKPSNVVGTAAALCLALAGGLAAWAGQTPLATLNYQIGGTVMQVTPATLSVPKGIAGSVLVSVISGGSTNNATVAQLTAGAYVQAVIRGPGFPAPQTLISKPNAPLSLPPISLSGNYELDSIALVDAVTGQVRLQGTPSSVPVNVFDQLLVTSVTSEPLTMDQIQQAGISIDESSFSAVQFNVEFSLNGQSIPISFPVVSPVFTQATELIPADEVQAQLQQAALINQQIASKTVVQLPAGLQQTANLNIQLQGLNFQVADPGEPASLGLTIPSIPALMVIPGNIGFLHQFFSVQVFTENGAPAGSGLSVGNIMAQLELPPGPDGIVSTNYSQPGDDPLRFAKVNNQVSPSIQPVADPGPGGQLGSSNNITQLQPGETGQAVFYVEGLQQGLWVMNLNLTGTLYGLAAGAVPITAQAAGSVLVRNPNFSITFTHPDVVRVSEPYTASINVMNTGVTPANLVSVTLYQNSISGAILAPGQSQTIQLNTILPGQSATATYHLIAETTGQIQFSDITTSDNSVTGHFNFTMGVDAQGVPLSPDTIVMPDYVDNLPTNIVIAATRVLGQALSIATAAQLPPGIVSVGNPIITTRVLDLADAGQRVQYGDPLKRVLTDLLRNWQGGVVADTGFDSLVRTSDAGQEWTSVLYTNMEIADGLTGTGRLLDRAPDLAGLGQQFVVASTGPGQLFASFTGTTNTAAPPGSSQPYSLVYPGTNGLWAVTPELTNAVFTWTYTNGPPLADMAVLEVNSNGLAQQLRWQVPNPPVTAIYTFALDDPTQQLRVDTNGDGVVDFTLSPTQTAVHELPPTLVAVQQDLSIVAGRPATLCIIPPAYYNYGTVVAVVYSKLMTQASAGQTNSYTLDGNNGADSVQIQPSGRVALLNLRKGISAIIARTLTISGVADVRGNGLVAAPTPIQCYTPGTTNPFTAGVAIKGRVLNGDGSPAVGVPVTLTMYDQVLNGAAGCFPWTRRVSQVLTDSGGNYNLDYVMSGIPYSISASDTTALPPGALQLVAEATIGSQPNTQQLMQLVNASTNSAALLALFSAGSLDQAVAIVQGLDRAVFNDTVPYGSAREGQTVPVVLTFHGRATVTGQVVAADGVTPVPNAAVNLFPDPSTLELGRGVYADGNGQFNFPGVPLGIFTVQATSSNNLSATVLGYVNTPGETTNLVIPLPTNVVVYAAVAGQVFDTDNITPIPNARIYLGHYDGTGNTIRAVVTSTTADNTGSWEVTNVPVQMVDIAAVTFDGKRLGVRQGVIPVGGTVTYVNIALQAATTVSGQVTFDNGDPAPGALVAGGVVLVTADTNGNFQLQGVPVGGTTISAGLAANPAAGIDFPRLGSSFANIVAGEANYVVIKLRPAGRIYGQVFNAQGVSQPNIMVAIPQQGGFYWTTADTNGNYEFDNMGLGGYTLSAPANAVAPTLNVSDLSSNLASGNEPQIMAALNQAVSVFVGASDPLVNGDQLNFLPSSWGYTTANIIYDGQSVNANITFLPQGTVSGTVLNAQGTPIGAAVRLTGIGPDVTGLPVTTIRGDTTSDPATGVFGFTNLLLTGPFGLQAASPFYPVVVSTNGFTTPATPNATGLVLQFPPVNAVNGSIAGHVYYPDGSAVGQGVQVHITVSADYQILTDTNGFFNTQTEFPAVNAAYTVDVFDPSSGLVGTAVVSMTPGITNFVDVNLLSRNSTVQVIVLQANGQPAVGAQIELDQGSYPYQPPIYTTTDTNGVGTFTSLWQGTYSATAQFAEQSTRLFARGGAVAGPNQTVAITLHLGATGSINGTFVKQDGVTPVNGAEVTIGSLGFATTGTNGFFEFDGVPIGAYQISSSDPVTGANATTAATLSYNGQTQTVLLVEATLGTVSGLVEGSYSTGFVSGAAVTIGFSDGVTAPRTVTTAPNGSFNFPASPMGNFFLRANYKLPGANGQFVYGQATGTLSPSSTNVSINIQLQPLTTLTVRVVRDDGVTPALNTSVSIGGPAQDTSTNGDVVFVNLTVPASYTVTAISLESGDVYDGVQTNVAVSLRSANNSVTLMLPGVGSVEGTVAASDGTTPVSDANVTLEFLGGLFGGNTLTALTDAQGRFALDGIPVGSFLVTAASESLGASENGVIAIPGETNVVNLRLGASGSILGVVVRADGVTPVPGVEVAISFTSQSSNAGRASYSTDPNGGFHFDNVPVGPVQVQAAEPAFNGIINFTTALTNNGEVLNLGNVPFDETFPQVVAVNPTNNQVGVPITNSVVLQFNKPLDPATIGPSGIFIEGTNGIVTSTVTLMRDTNGLLSIVRIQPAAPLQSLQNYGVFVLSGDVPGPNGNLFGSGPLDLVGRPLAATFNSDFTTADNTPPVLLSIFPSNNAVQINPSAVPRLVFDKTLNPTTFVFAVTGPSGAVPGTPGLGINGQVMTFLPTAYLSPNATYSMVISNVFDLAGNRATGDPFHSTFATIVTIGPAIASLQLASNAVPTGGSTVPVIATLATNQAGDSVRFTQDFNPIGTATNAPYQVSVRLPTSGTSTIRAIATDPYGNDGQVVQLAITVTPPTPPSVHFALVSPTNSPVPSGSPLTVAVTTTSDTTISNLMAIISGPASGAVVSTNGPSLLVQGIVSNTAVAGRQVQVLAQAIDSLGLSSGERAFGVLISDGTPPSLAILSPTNNQLLAAGASFPLAAQIADNSSNLALSLIISGGINFTQTNALVLTPNVRVTNVFTVPLAGAPTNGGAITATLTATDAATNRTTVSSVFWLPGSVGPGIASLAIASNLPPLAGLTVPIQAVLVTNGPGITVEFFQDTNVIAIVAAPPYEVEVKLPATGSTAIRAIATDAFGLAGPPAQLAITVHTNVLPSVQFSRVTPPSGPVPSGSSFSVEVAASGNPGLFQITAGVGGVATGPPVAALGTNLLVQGSVPPTALAGQQVQVTAQAVDGLGQSSGPQALNLPVSDGTAPGLAFLSPADNEQLTPGQPLDIEVLVSDNSSNVTLNLVVSGSVTATQNVALVLTPNTPLTNTFTVPLPNEPTNGTPLVATLTATDAAGNANVQSRVFWLPGTETTVVWERQALGQTIQCTNGPGSYTYPNNNNWSQSAVFGKACGTETNVEIVPSNWSTTNYPNNPGLDVVLGSVGGAGTLVDVSVVLHSLSIQSDGSLTMNSPGPGSSITAANYFFEGDGLLGINSCCGPTTLVLTNGTMAKTGGSNVFTIASGVSLLSTNAVLEADSGTLQLPGNNSYYTNGVFSVSSNATLNLAPSGATVTFAGAFSGSGEGAAMLNAGTLSAGVGGVTFNVPAPLFQWAGGEMLGSEPMTNAGVLNYTGSGGGTLAGSLYNSGLFQHSAGVNLGLYSPGAGSDFVNLPSGVYWLQSDAGLAPVSCCAATALENLGVFRKSGGTGNSKVSVLFENLGGLIDVETGTLTLANNGSSSGGAVNVAAGAALDLTGGQSPNWAGEVTGSGAGAVLLASGTLNANPSLTLNFTNGLFRWSGGTLSGLATNIQEVDIVGTNTSLLAGQFDNAGLVRHVGTGSLAFYSPGPGSLFNNLSGATYQFEDDGAITVDSCCAAVVFANYGVLRKIGGTNESSIAVRFDNLGGTIDVESGQIILANNGTSSNGTFTVAANAAVDLTGGQSPAWAGTISASGEGAVELNSGQLNASPWLALNCAPGVFQWTGGTLVGLTTNLDVLVLSGTGTRVVAGAFYNAGLVRHTGSGPLQLYSPGSGTLFHNLPGATYQVEADTDLSSYSCCAGTIFENDGLFRKIGGSTNTTISVGFNSRGGAVEVDTGRLTLGSSQSSSVDGTFTIAAGASVDLTGGYTLGWAGRMTGTGAGQLYLLSGQINANALTLDCAPGVFQWAGGTFSGSVTNVNEVDVSAPSVFAGSFVNAGLVHLTAAGSLGLSSPGAGSQFFNLPGGEVLIDGNAGIGIYSCCAPTVFNNAGLVRKSAGTNANIGVTFNNQNGAVEVDGGVLSLGNSSYAQGSGAFTVILGGTNAGQFGQLSAGNVALAGPLNVQLAPGFTPPLGSQFQILSCASLTGTFKGVGMPGGVELNYGAKGVSLVVTGAVSLSAPSIVLQPTNAIGVAGGAAVFTATATGAAPLAYQWQLNQASLTNNARVSGANSAQLMVGNLETADAGAYRLVVTNALGSAVSSNASLTLVPCVAPASGLIGFWTGDGSAADWVGSHDGTLESGAAYAPAQDGLAFSLDGASGYVDLGAWSAGSNWTWTAWVNPSSVPSGRRTIVGGVNACVDWALTMSSGIFGVLCPPPGGCSQTITGGPAVVPGTWYFVAGTCDGLTARIYVNGQLGGSGPVQTNYVGTTAGTRIGGEFCCGGDNFPGLIREVALYNRALSPAEVQALYSSGDLELCVPPQILAQPVSQSVPAGQPASFNVVARGLGQLTYQWQANGSSLVDNTQVVGSQSNVLTLTSVQLSNAAAYSVVVTSPGGSTTSSNATLTPVSGCVPAPAGIIAWWQGNGNFQDVVSGFNGTPVGQVAFEPAEVGEGFHLVNSAISASGNFDFSASNAMTIELWFELNVDNSYNGLVSAINCCTYRFMVDPSGHLFYDPATHDDFSVGPVLRLGQFYHAAMVIVGGGQASIYLNGQLISSSANGVPAVLPSVSTFLLGAGESASTWTMQDGIIDEVSIYDRALSASEVAGIYAAGAAGKCLPSAQTLVAPPTASPLLETRFESGSFAFKFLSAANQNYTVESNTDLRTTNWVPVTHVIGNGSLMQLSLPATNSSQTFFRLRQP